MPHMCFFTGWIPQTWSAILYASFWFYSKNFLPNRTNEPTSSVGHNLKPLGIQLTRLTMGNKVYTSNTEGLTWLYAKTIVQNADALVIVTFSWLHRIVQIFLIDGNPSIAFAWLAPFVFSLSVQGDGEPPWSWTLGDGANLHCILQLGGTRVDRQEECSHPQNAQTTYGQDASYQSSGQTFLSGQQWAFFQLLAFHRFVDLIKSIRNKSLDWILNHWKHEIYDSWRISQRQSQAQFICLSC